MRKQAKGTGREARFAQLYNDAYEDLLRFVQRRAGPDQAEDIVHDVFVVAWRRFDDMPSESSDARAWLFGTARNCLLAEQRIHHQRGALAIRMAAEAEAFVASPDDSIALQLDIATAWGRLTLDHQEALALTAWENLTSSQAGKVLGISAVAFRVRLHRARASLRRALGNTTATTTTDQYSATEQLT